MKFRRRAERATAEMRRYSEKFKRRMIERLTGPKAISTTQLAKEVNVAQSTLWKWLTKSRAITVPSSMSVKKTNSENDDRRPEDWSVEEKIQVVLEAAALSETGLGAFLRTKGLHEADLAGWRSAVFAGARTALGDDERRRDGGARGAEAKQIRELTKQVQALEKELARKEKALAEAAALLVLKKKLRALQGDEDDDEPGKSGR